MKCGCLIISSEQKVKQSGGELVKVESVMHEGVEQPYTLRFARALLHHHFPARLQGRELVRKTRIHTCG